MLFYFFIARSLISEYGYSAGLHATFLMWSFFVLCLPIARGSIIFGVPFEICMRKRLFVPEVLSWCIALSGNFASYKIASGTYYKTNLTHLLLYIIDNPWPYWIIVGVCGVATFMSAFSRTLSNRKFRALGQLFIVCSFITTFILAYTEFIIVLNAHGSA
jgi:hypothetical protein